MRFVVHLENGFDGGLTISPLGYSVNPLIRKRRDLLNVHDLITITSRDTSGAPKKKSFFETERENTNCPFFNPCNAANFNI